MKKKNECSDSAVARASTDSSLRKHLQAAVDHVKAPAHHEQAGHLQFQLRAEGGGGKLQADQRSARDHHAAHAEPRQEA